MGLGGICGAVTGAFMLLGFMVAEETEERQTRYRAYDLVREFVRQFEERHGTLVCKELLGGVDPSTEAGRQEAAERGLFQTVCPAFVRTAAEILGGIWPFPAPRI